MAATHNDALRAQHAEQALQQLETVCKAFDGQGIASIGANAALQAMAQHWKNHLLEGHPSRVLIVDMAELVLQLECMRESLQDALQAPARA